MCFLFTSIGILSFHLNSRVRQIGGASPLWYYVLKEAEVRANGNSLGELGSRIVCETIIGQLMNDPESYLNQHDAWDPSNGVKLPNPGGDPNQGDLIVTIRDFFRFAGLIA
jgi:hypothetical protein